MSLTDTLSPDLIHHRTEKGQLAVAQSTRLLSPEALRLLLLFNGFTPTRHLLTRLQSDMPEAPKVLAELEQMGLVRTVHTVH